MWFWTGAGNVLRPLGGSEYRGTRRKRRKSTAAWGAKGVRHGYPCVIEARAGAVPSMGELADDPAAFKCQGRKKALRRAEVEPERPNPLAGLRSQTGQQGLNPLPKEKAQAASRGGTTRGGLNRNFGVRLRMGKPAFVWKAIAGGGKSFFLNRRQQADPAKLVSVRCPSRSPPFPIVFRDKGDPLVELASGLSGRIVYRTNAPDLQRGCWNFAVRPFGWKGLRVTGGSSVCPGSRDQRGC